MARRGAGEGSIYCRGDGRWVSYLRLPDGRKKFFTGPSRKDVQARLQAAQHAVQEGRLALGRDQTLRDYLVRWQEEIVRHSVRESTRLNYELAVRRLQPLIGHAKLRALTPEQIQLAYSKLLGTGLSARTVRQIHMVLRRALKQAVLWRLLDRNPTDAVRPPRPERKEMSVLDREQVARLLAGTVGDRDHALWTLLVTTGVREGEALGLLWSDVDLERGTVTIRRALQRLSGRSAFVEPKTARSRRTVPIPPSTRAVLAEHRRRQLEEQTLADSVPRGRDLVFCTADGDPLNASSVCIRLHRTLERLGLPQIRVHDLRHTAATHLLVRGVHPKVVQDLLGHSTIAITLDTYSHVMPSLARDATEYMEDFFGTPATYSR